MNDITLFPKSATKPYLLPRTIGIADSIYPSVAVQALLSCLFSR